MPRSLILAGVVLTGLSLPAASQDASTVVAKVGDVEITLGHMAALRAELPAQINQMPAEVVFNGILEQMIQQEVLATEVPDPVGQALQLNIDNEIRSIKAGDVVATLLDGAVTEEALQAAYDAEFAGFEGDVEWNASHILVETEDEAAALITALDGGADFAELAKEKSTGPSGPRGGELGWFGAGMMVPEFQTAVEGLEVGGVSAPVQTQFGWHVVKLNDQRTAPPPSLDELRGDLTQRLQADAIAAKVAELSEGLAIERPDVSAIDPTILQSLDLSAE